MAVECKQFPVMSTKFTRYFYLKKDTNDIRKIGFRKCIMLPVVWKTPKEAILPDGTIHTVDCQYATVIFFDEDLKIAVLSLDLHIFEYTEHTMCIEHLFNAYNVNCICGMDWKDVSDKIRNNPRDPAMTLTMTDSDKLMDPLNHNLKHIMPDVHKISLV